MYTNFKTFIYKKLPIIIQKYVKEYMQHKFQINTFLIIPVGIESNNKQIILQGEILTIENSFIYPIQKWFIEQGCVNENILILITEI